MENKVLSMLGLATRARKLVSGEFSVEKAVKEGKAVLVLVAEDASNNTKKLFTNMCAYYQVPMYVISNKESLGHAMGKEIRASIAILATGFANAIMKHMDDN